MRSRSGGNKIGLTWNGVRKLGAGDERRAIKDEDRKKMVGWNRENRRRRLVNGGKGMFGGMGKR